MKTGFKEEDEGRVGGVHKHTESFIRGDSCGYGELRGQTQSRSRSRRRSASSGDMESHLLMELVSSSHSMAPKKATPVPVVRAKQRANCRVLRTPGRPFFFSSSSSSCDSLLSKVSRAPSGARGVGVWVSGHVCGKHSP